MSESGLSLQGGPEPWGRLANLHDYSCWKLGSQSRPREQGLGCLCWTIWFFGFFCFETGVCVAPVALDLTMLPRLALNSQRPTCLCLLSTGIKGMHQLFQPRVEES